MHPMLKPALRRCWRDRQTVQFGVASAHAVVLGPVDTTTGSFLDLLDGTRSMGLLREEARSMGLPVNAADDLVSRLTTAGLLDDPTADAVSAATPRIRGRAWDRLRPDLASLSVQHPEPGEGTRLLAVRRAMRVQVKGAGRVGAAVAAILSASGVGQVDVADGGCVEPWDVSPSGLPAESVGQRRDIAARRVARSVAPDTRPPAREPASRVGEPGLALVVLAPRDGLAAYAPEPGAYEPMLASGTPHLFAGVIENTGVVGPLVLPGGSACAACLALERAEREPGWPRMLAQWRSGRGSAALACDTALATVVAGTAAAHALAFLDGRLPLSLGARVEFTLPDLAWTPQRIAPHPDCMCGAVSTCDQAPFPASAEANRTTAR